MAGNILESITAQYHSLTRSGKKLADYIFAHTGEAQYFSISTLAENSGVSEASITRFCHGLGLAGYNDFKLALAKTDHVTDMGELSDSPQGIASEDSLNTIFQKIHKASVLSLTKPWNFWMRTPSTKLWIFWCRRTGFFALETAAAW